MLVELQSVCSAVNGVGLQSQRVGLQSQREAISAVVDERAGGANHIRSSVLVELDLEEEYQRVNGAHRAGLDM